MALVLVTGMPLEPHSCVCCGGGSRDADGEIDQSVFAEAVDINWGDSVYICRTCVRVIAELFGFRTPEDVKELEDKIEALKEYKKKYKKLDERVKTMLDGARARKEVTEDASIT
jgi:hypothetical protein